MNQIEKKSRFINFITRGIKYNPAIIFKNIKKIKRVNYPIILKLKIKDIKTILLLIIEEKSINVLVDAKIERKVNCFITINKAKTLHNLLRGKISITNISLINKLTINAFNINYINIFYILITSLKKSYNEIIKGTRFTLIKK